MTSTAPPVSNPVSNPAQVSNGGSSSLVGSSPTVAAPTNNQASRSYAIAATNTALAAAPIASSTPQSQGETLLQSRHAKSSSTSQGNGKNMIPPAVPAVGAPAIVNSSSMMNGGPQQTEHGRKPSVVTISAAGTSGYMPNGGPVTSSNRPNISFGSMSAASGSPAIANTVPYHSHNNSLSQPATNPRITSPANSPSPIPQPAASGGKPPAGLQGQGNGLNFGSMGGDANDMTMRPGTQIPLTPSHQSAHIRRDSSQSAHSETSAPVIHAAVRQHPGGSRGRGGYGHGPYGQQMAHSPNTPYRQLPGPQRGNPGFHQQFHREQAPMGAHQHSPYRATRSPAMNQGMMQQQFHLANNTQMPPYAYPGYPQHLQPQQNVYNMPHQYDPAYGYYPAPYGMHPGVPFQGAPPSPRPYTHVPPVAQPGYVHGQYTSGAAAQSMSRTPSAASERPGSTLSQPQTPVMPSGNHPNQPVTQVPISGSPANKSTFAIPPKTKGKGIVITNPEGKVLDFTNKSASPAPVPAPAPAPAPRSPVVVTSTSTPPPGASPAPEVTHNRTESKLKSAAEKKQDFQDQVKRQLEVEKAEEKQKAGQAEEKQASVPSSEQDATAMSNISTKPSLSDDSKNALVTSKVDEGQDKVKKKDEEKKDSEENEAERLEREIAEMEELERQREEAEEKYRQSKKKENEEKALKEAAKADEVLKKAEKEAEEAEEARQKKGAVQEETEEEKEEREKLFASLKKPAFGPGASSALSSGVGDSRASTPASDTSSMPPPPPPSSQQPQPQPQPQQQQQQQQNQQSRLPSSRQNKPAALKLETKPVEPAQPTPGMQALKSARFLQVKNEAISYPEGVSSPNPALNMSGKRNGRQYDKSFLLQFQEVFKEKPSIDWDVKVKETVGESDSARPVSARPQPSRQASRPSITGGFPQPQMGSFGQGGRTLPSGRASTSGSGRTPTMSNPLATLANRPGGFPVGPPPMSRSGSITVMGQGVPPSPRPGGSARGRNSRRGGPDKVPSRREEEQMQKAMPLTANQALAPLETSKTGWKPMSLTQAAAPALLPSGHMPPDMVQRKVKAALNKMTPEKFEKISDQILEIAAQSKDETDGRTLRQVIALTFEKACDEAHWASMYAKFCKRMLETMSPEIKDANVRDKNGNSVVGGALFRKYLLTRCQEEFERGWEVNLPPKPEGQTEEAEMMSDEYYIAAAAKRRGLGLIQFIGELYKLGMLTFRIMHECVHKLLDFEGLPDESAIESLVKLLRTVGATMESTEAGPKMIAVYFNRIETIMDMEGLPSRMRFMLMDTADLRKGGWRSKDDQKGPKTIQEIHQEVAVQMQQADLERQRQNQKGQGRLPMGRGDARNFSGGMMPPPDYHRNVVAADELRKLSKGAGGRNVSSGPATLGPSSMFGSRSSSGRKGFGPAGLAKSNDDSGASSRTGTPPVKDNKEKDSSSHVNAFSALASLDGEGQDEASPASSPPVVKSKPNDGQTKSKLATSAESQKK